MADGEMADGEMADSEMADGEMADGEMADGEMADGQQGPMRGGRDDPLRARLVGAVPLYGVRRGWHPAPGLGRRPRSVPGPHDTRMPAGADSTDASRATA